MQATKEDVVFDKVPLSTQLKGYPLYSAGTVEVFGSNAICRHILSVASDKETVIGPDHASEGKLVEEWLEQAETALDKSALGWFTDIAFGAADTSAHQSEAAKFLEKIESVCAAGAPKPLLSSLSLADIAIWAALYPGYGAGGVLSDADKSKYPAVEEWFNMMSGVQCCKDALVRLRCRSARTLLPPSKPKDASEERFYITTAINYTNGNPHMGHAYEAVTSDIIARWHRAYGRKVFYLTGTDEHGQKIADTAENLGVKPIDICDKYANAFQELNKRLGISNDFYIRTTMDKHKKLAQLLFLKAADAGDIYLDTYEGWYNVREETFVTETEAQASDYKDPSSGKPLEKRTEESYFFRMSKYQDRLLAYIEKNADFIQPVFRRNEILAKLREPLRDLSVSRTNFDWGIPVPEHPALKSDKKHVMYVWFDALSNYVTGCDWPDGPNRDFWPANIHLIGKDIIWFHCVIWPCMLFSCEMPLPKCVYAHGFINDKEGKKMSKSLGNVIDPHEQLDKFSSDSFRFYLAYASPFGQDIPFAEEGLSTMHNAELADSLGNLMHRATNITQKYCGGKVPDVTAEPCFDFLRLCAESCAAYEAFQLQDAAMIVLTAVKDTNKYLTDLAPWHIKADPANGATEEQAQHKRMVVCRSVLEAMYILAHFLQPLLPNGSLEMFCKLGTNPVSIPKLDPSFNNLKPGTTTYVGDVLYAKIEKTVTEQKEIFPCDMRVGRIDSVEDHPEAENLYVLKVFLGDELGVKTVCAGLKGKYEVSELQSRSVVVLMNLKPAEFKGIKSEGMVLVGDQQKPTKVQGLLQVADTSVAPGTKLEAKGADTVVAENMELKVFQKLELKVSSLLGFLLG